MKLLILGGTSFLGPHTVDAAVARGHELTLFNRGKTNADIFPQLELLMPHAQKAFDLLVGQVENKVALPPSQCVPRGSAISGAPAQPGHCTQLFVP